ncbi:biotin transporter BioY [Planctomycetota bacterium]|nr:biotin transporter BioY [Planctomycetota bacterium]
MTIVTMSPCSSGRFFVTSAGGAAAIWLGGLAAVPMVPAPVTLQTLALMLTGALFGGRSGALAGILFLAAVLAGAPILSSGASAPGAAFLDLGTGGFVVAFILGGAIAGLADGRFRHDLVVFLGAHLAILIVGFAWLFLGTDLPLADGAASLLGLLPGALAKSAVAALIVRRLIGQRESA